MHSKSRQIIAFHIGDRSKASGQALMAKIPEDLKKKPFFTQMTSQLTEKLSPFCSTDPVGKSLVRQVIWRDLTALCGKDVVD